MIQYFQITYPVLAGFNIGTLPLNQRSFTIKRHVETAYEIIVNRSVLPEQNIR